MKDEERSEGVNISTVLVHSVLSFVMGHINNVKAKDPKVLL